MEALDVLDSDKTSRGTEGPIEEALGDLVEEMLDDNNPPAEHSESEEQCLECGTIGIDTMDCNCWRKDEDDKWDGELSVYYSNEQQAEYYVEYDKAKQRLLSYYHGNDSMIIPFETSDGYVAISIRNMNEIELERCKEDEDDED